MCYLQSLYCHSGCTILGFADAPSKGTKATKAGRVRGVLLPQEYDLERMIQNIVNPLPSWNASTPAREWQGVQCSDEGNILKFEAESKSLRGTLLWSLLPRSLTRFSVYANDLSGEIDLGDLPEKLRSLNASYNRFTGTVDLCHLPSTLCSLILSKNYLSGHVTFEHLPSIIRSLALRNNAELTGTVHSQSLPMGLKYTAFTDTKIVVIQ